MSSVYLVRNTRRDPLRPHETASRRHGWRGLVPAMALGLGLVVGCASQEATIVVVVRTDLTPGGDFTRVETRGTGGAILARRDASGREWSDGVRVAEIQVAPGSHVYSVVAVQEETDRIVRPLRVAVQSGDVRVVTVLLTRNCIDVECPVGPEATPMACVGGECTVAECTPETPEVCTLSECDNDADCPEPDTESCSTYVCLSRTCFLRRDHSLCAETEWCSEETGQCTETPPVLLPRFPWNGYRFSRADGSVGLSARFRFDPVTGRPRVHIQVSAPCAVGADLAGCAFDPPLTTETRLPSIGGALGLPRSTEVPVGVRYRWRARACDAEEVNCTDWTTPRYFDFGRVTNDFDGDGRSELVVAAPEEPRGSAPGVGRVYRITADLAMTAIDYPGTSLSDTWFGHALSAGDFDGDSYDDLAVAAPLSRPIGGAPRRYSCSAADLRACPLNRPRASPPAQASEPDAPLRSSVTSTGMGQTSSRTSR